MKFKYSILTILFFIGMQFTANTQSDTIYPFKTGLINYNYSGDFEGTKKMVFSDYGNRLVVFSKLSKTTSFYSVKTVQTENVIEYLTVDASYHINLDNKRAQIIHYPIDVLTKTLGIREKINSYREALEEIGGKMIGKDTILNKECETWSLRSKKLWIWNGFLLKMESKGLGKNYTMLATNLDFESAIPEEIFNFPAEIPIPKN